MPRLGISCCWVNILDCSRLQHCSKRETKQQNCFIIANSVLAKAKLEPDGSSDVGTDFVVDVLLMEVVWCTSCWTRHLKWGALPMLFTCYAYRYTAYLVSCGLRLVKTNVNSANLLESLQMWSKSFPRHHFLSVLTQANLTGVSSNHISPHCYSWTCEIPQRGYLPLFIIIVTFCCLPVVSPPFHYLLYRMQPAHFRSHDCNCAQLSTICKFWSNKTNYFQKLRNAMIMNYTTVYFATFVHPYV